MYVSRIRYIISLPPLKKCNGRKVFSSKYILRYLVGTSSVLKRKGCQITCDLDSRLAFCRFLDLN